MKSYLSPLRKLLSWLLVAGALFYLGQSVLELQHSLASYTLVPSWQGFVLCTIVSLLWLSGLFLGWVWMLRFHTGSVALPGWGLLARVYMQSFLARYVPGKVWPAVSLHEQLREWLPAAHVLRSYVLQQLHLTASGAILAAGVLPWVLSRDSATPPLLEPVMFLALAGALVWVLFPHRIFALAARLLPLRPEWRRELVFEGSRWQWGGGFGLFLMTGVLQGVAIIPLWHSLAGAEQSLSLIQMLWVVCAYAAARIVGQAAMVAPAGIGIREGAFVFLVAGLSSEVALVSVLWFRLVATLVELLVWVVTRFAEKP